MATDGPEKTPLPPEGMNCDCVADGEPTADCKKCKGTGKDDDSSKALRSGILDDLLLYEPRRPGDDGMSNEYYGIPSKGL